MNNAVNNASVKGECAILGAFKHGYHGFLTKPARCISGGMVKHLEHVIDNLFWPVIAQEVKQKVLLFTSTKEEDHLINKRLSHGIPPWFV